MIIKVGTIIVKKNENQNLSLNFLAIVDLDITFFKYLSHENGRIVIKNEPSLF